MRTPFLSDTVKIASIYMALMLAGFLFAHFADMKELRDSFGYYLAMHIASVVAASRMSGALNIGSSNEDSNR